jgi:hypothetical protein
MGLQVAGAGMSMMSAMNQADAQKQQYAYQAQVAANNAIIASQQASVAIQNGQTQEQTQQLKTGQIYGAQRAAMAANGIDLGEGSATDMLATTEFMGKRDQLTIRDNAARQAWGYQVQAQNYTDSSNANNATGDAINPFMAGATSLLGSATSIAGSWGKYKQASDADYRIKLNTAASQYGWD